MLIDASVVRLVLVPAVMELLGKANWWLPGWLGRLLPARRAEAPGRDDPRPGRWRPIRWWPAELRAGRRTVRGCARFLGQEGTQMQDKHEAPG